MNPLKSAIQQSRKLMRDSGEAHLVVAGPGRSSGHEVISISEWEDWGRLILHIVVPQCMDISISPGNIKLVYIPSVSLPPPMTCSDKMRPCYGIKRGQHCYAMTNMYLRLPNIKRAWDRNWKILQHDPKLYFAQISQFLWARKPGLFRFHVGGGCPDQAYLDLVDRICEVHERTRFLMFEKGYDIGLDFSSKPDNLAIILSIWPEMDMPPDGKGYGAMPFAWIEGDPRVMGDPVSCSGLCTTCEKCWDLEKLGRDVVLHRH